MALRKISNLINIDDYTEVRIDGLPTSGDLMQLSLLKDIDGVDTYYSTSIDYQKIRDSIKEYIHNDLTSSDYQIFRDDIKEYVYGVVYESEWFDMSSQDGVNSFKTVEHNLGYIPSRVKVYTKFKDGVNEGYIMDGTGSQGSDDDDTNGQYGGLIFAYNENNVKLWAPDKNNDGNNGYIIGVSDGWGGETDIQISHTASVKVKIWK